MVAKSAGGCGSVKFVGWLHGLVIKEYKKLSCCVGQIWSKLEEHILQTSRLF